MPPGEAPSALVVGAQGVLGHFLARGLAAAGWRVLRAGRRPEDDPGFRLLDLDRAETIAPACAGVDLVVTSVPHPSLALERHVLRDGGLLLSVAGVSAAERERLRAESAGARGLVVVHGGLVPGVATLVAADLVASHPDADLVEVGLCFSAAATSGRGGGAFGHHLLAGRRRHPTGVVPLPPPFGPRRCMDVGMPGEGWLGQLARGRQTALWVFIAERPLHLGLLAANALGVISFLPRGAFVGGPRALPAELSREPVCEWVAVGRGGRRLAACTVEGEGDYRTTVAATVVFADALLAHRRRAPDRHGVSGPEELFTLAELTSAFAAAGVRIVPRLD